MQIKTILRLVGMLLTLFSFTMLTPLVVNLFFNESVWTPFLHAFAVTFITGLTLWFCFRHNHRELKIRDGFLIVVLFWSVLCGFAALPLMLASHPSTGFTDSIFESVSGFTTTGASVLTELQALPHAILFYRQQLQFLGGMGIVVLAVAILPMLGIGGMQLYRAETPGPLKDAKLTPRIAQTAKALWLIYCLLTLACMLCYWLGGMSWFDAIGESFATVSTGGFSLHDASFAYYDSSLIESIASVFMILGGTNFALHFLALKNGRIRHYWQDEEFRWFLCFCLTASVLVALSLWYRHFFNLPHHALSKSLFNVISMATTTGFSSASFAEWPTYVPILMTLMAIIGGCGASTSGGIKMMRAILLFKQSRREIIKLIHPNAIINIKFGHTQLPDHVLQSMWGFISAFIALFLLLMVLLIALGNDVITSAAAMTASLANAGVGIGQISHGFASLNTPSKWVLIFAMIAGRLEIFSILVLLSPKFWQK